MKQQARNMLSLQPAQTPVPHPYQPEPSQHQPPRLLGRCSPSSKSSALTQAALGAALGARSPWEP